MEPRRRRIRASYKQLKLLVQFMRDNPNLIKGVDYRTTPGKRYHDTKWKELANLLNAQNNGMNKSPREWKRYWKDLKSGIRKKVRSMNKDPGRPKILLSSIEQVIYKDMCVHRHRKNTIPDENECSYIQIPTESDSDHEKYEVEYLEDSSCDETQITNITDFQPVVQNFSTPSRDSSLNGGKAEIVNKNIQTRNLLEQDDFLIDSVLNETNYTIKPKTQIALENNGTDNRNNDDNIDVLTDIRNHLKELVAVQKERARSELRLATAHERRAILEEKRVRIEERRLKMEERRVALEESKLEALEKRSFAQERLASAAERKNEIAEHRFTNADVMSPEKLDDH